MKTLLLIPSVVKTGLDAEVAADRHPTMDYHALAAALRDAAARGGSAGLRRRGPGTVPRRPSGRANSAGGTSPWPSWRFAAGRNIAAIFSNGENVGIPLALLLGTGAARDRPCDDRTPAVHAEKADSFSDS